MLLSRVGRYCLRPSSISASAGCPRWIYSDQKYVKVEEDLEMKNVAIVTMHKNPVNSLCSDHLRELNATFKALAKDDKYQAAVLTSGFPGIFSAGLDLLSMYNRTYDEIYTFWSNFQTAWITLYGNPLITVAAINGSSPAGGCLLAMSCDHRVMAEGKFGIGLNETKLGLVAPFWLKETMKNVIGFRETDKALQAGTLFLPLQAKEVGLVDVVTSMDEVVPSCRSFIKEYLKLPYEPRSLTKQMMRQDTIDQLKAKLHEDADFTANFLRQDVVQKNLGKYVESLAQG